jgi:hypothetical protein
LAVLSQDIFQIPSEDLPKTESVLTIVGGKIAYTSGVLANKIAFMLSMLRSESVPN